MTFRSSVPYPRRALLCLAFGTLLALMGALPAVAGPVGDAKAAGQIGERPDGYLGVVGSAPGSVVNLVRSINRQRRDQYRSIASQNGTSLGAVETIMGQRLIGEAPRGTYVMDGGGNWVRK